MANMQCEQILQWTDCHHIEAGCHRSGPSTMDRLLRPGQVFTQVGSKRGGEHEATIRDLHAKIGELTV